MTVGSLFSGIGGLELGLERAGMEVKWQVEIDPYCRRVLAKHWPDVTRYEDVRDVGEANLEPVDLICGGFPCQPVSQAGKRLAQDDPRWLWPEFARIIRELRPRYALMENVPGLLVRGFGDVLGDLAEAGYDAEWCVLGADDVGAPHRRKRVLVVAHAQGESERPGLREGEQGWQRGRRPRNSRGEVAHADSGRLPIERIAQPAGIESPRGRVTDGCGDDGRLDNLATLPDTIRTVSKSGTGRRGVRESHTEQHGSHWATEPDVGRVAHGVPHRVDRLRALGNAVVPQVSEWIGRRIMGDA